MIFKKEGKVNITISSAVDNKVNCSKEVTIVRPFIERVIVDTEAEMTVGVSEKIKVAVNPKYALLDVEWSLTNNEIAVITEEGVITGLKEGSVVAICKSKTDALVRTGIFITFTKQNVEATDKINPIKISLEANNNLSVGEQISISAVIEQDNSFKDVKWSSSNEKIAVVNENDIVIALMPGVVSIKCESVYDSNIFGIVEFEIK